MKAFRFTPQRLLAWREIERDLAAARVQQARAAAERAARDLSAIDGALTRSPDASSTGAALANFEMWKRALQRQRPPAAQRHTAARAHLMQQQAALTEASRKVRLLEKMRETRFAQWQQDLERETSAFAAEVHLSRLARH